MRSIFLLFLAIVFAVPDGPADAADTATCRYFVVAMRKLAEKEAANRCGYWGKFSSAATSAWCAKEKPEAVHAAQTKDGLAILRCERCREYSDHAAAAALDNKLFRCGLTGPRWDPDPAAHFNHCMARLAAAAATGGIVYANTPVGIVPTVAPGSGLPNRVKQEETDMHILNEEVERTDAIKACKAQVRDRFSKDEIDKCDKYAKEAVEDAKFNVKKKCGATMPVRWSTNTEDHFMFCLPKIGDANGRKDLESEEAIRDHGVEGCKTGHKLSEDGKPIKRLGKKRPGSGGPGKSIAGAPAPGDKKGSAMTNPAGSAGISTSRDPKTLPSGGAGAFPSQNTSFGTGGSNTSRNAPPSPPTLPTGGAGAAAPRPVPSAPSGGLAPVVGTGALDRGGMVAPRGLPAGSNSGTR